MSQDETHDLDIEQEVKRRFWTATNLPALIATIVVLIGTYIAENISYEFRHQHQRSDLQDRANLLGSRLQGQITANVELVRGLAATIATEPAITQERFSSLAKSLYYENNTLINIAVAPGLVVSMVYPLKGNLGVIGLDYNRNDAQRAVAMRARTTGETSFAGPVNLIQGGQGFIVRYPIFNELPSGESRFWGIMSAVIDTRALYQATGILEDLDYRYALFGRDGKGEKGAQFFGDVGVIESDPVKVKIDFGVGEWVLYAIPEQGWLGPSSTVWLIRGAALLIWLLVVIPILIVSWLYRERGVHLNSNITSQNKLARVTKRLEMALQSSQIGVWEYDPVADTVEWDDRMKEMYQFPAGETDIDKIWQSRLHPEDASRVHTDLRVALRYGTLYKTEFRACLPDGNVITIRAVGSLLIDKRGRRRMIGVNWDITEHVQRAKELEQARAESERRYQALELAQEKIQESALHDFLTGLPNRRFLDDLLNGRNGRAVRINDQTCLLKIDLDGFKEVNDNLGHAAGDAMLVRVAELLRFIVLPGEFAVRIGGDEFVIVCQTDVDFDRPIAISNQLKELLQPAFNYEGRLCRVGASIGIALAIDAKNDPDKLLSNADLALYQSKQNGRGRYSFFSEPLYEKARKERDLADDLLRGIENREFVAFYQGQYCAIDHSLIGAEALARWQHPERGLLGPHEFVDLAESLGVMGAIDAMILDHVIASRAELAKANLNPPRISVNVSSKRLGDKDLIDNLKRLEVDPKTLTFELVESTFLDRSDAQVAANIRQIRDMGIDIEIDDFGTAYASIVSLTHLLPNRLKIDRQLVLPVIESADQRELVHSIIHIGRTLGIGTVAEGVESMEHAEILRIMGVDVLQGYAFCRPLSVSDFITHHQTVLPQIKPQAAS